MYLKLKQKSQKLRDIQPAIVYSEEVITSKKMNKFQNELAEKM